MAKKILVEDEEIEKPIKKKTGTKKIEVIEDENKPLYLKIFHFFYKHKEIIGSIVSIIVIIVTTIGIINLEDKKKDMEAEQRKERAQEQTDNYIESLSYDTILGLKAVYLADGIRLSKVKPVALLLGKEDEHFTQSLAPKLEKVAKKYDVPVRFVDINKFMDFGTGDILDQNEYDIMNSLLGEPLKGIPVTIFVKDGERVREPVFGDTDERSIERAFEFAGFKKS